jgi:hypothetical protein
LQSSTTFTRHFLEHVFARRTLQVDRHVPSGSFTHFCEH